MRTNSVSPIAVFYGAIIGFLFGVMAGLAFGVDIAAPCRAL